MRGALLIGLLAACRASPAPLYPAGSDQDDGYGDLAQKSASLLTDPDDTPPWAPHRHHPHDQHGSAGGDAPYTGRPDPDDDHTGVSRAASYQVRETGLSGVVEGTITWRGPRPAARTTACGSLAPGVRIADDGAAGGVLVYIERVQAGRHHATSDDAGGLVVKRGCDLAPALQVITALPRALVIRGDATAARLRITLPTDAPHILADLEPAGRIALPAWRGITRIEADDGSLSPAWAVATDAPYYAITDDAGRYRLDELVPGSYDLTIVAPPAATDGRHGPTYGNPLVVHRAIRVGPGAPLHLDLAIP